MRFRILARFLLLVALPGAGFATATADGPQDNRVDNVRPIPPPGVEVPAADRTELDSGIAALGREIESLRAVLKTNPEMLELLPDVQIYHNAARYALTYNEFFNVREILIAKQLVRQGMERAQALKEGRAPWNTQTGLVARGYVSRIDGSVQPYGLVIPPTYHADSPHRHRLDAWFHGRGETLSELSFIDQRQRSPGEFTPTDTIVLHPYGRYCNANRFAGEVDLFEALEDVKKHYRIDESRIAVRGFSMGGAACWTFATHHPGLWAAAAPGAGFSETADFLKVFQQETLKPEWWEQKLWHQYDSTDYALNLFNLPTVAYSGEIDRQKQAADFMASALKGVGIEMVHIIGPKTAHAYQPDAKVEINRRIDAIMAGGRNPTPRRIRFTTWTLRYNRCAWLELDGLEKHWERTTVQADITGPDSVSLSTQNVTALTLNFAPGRCPLDNTVSPTVAINGQRVRAPSPLSDRSWTVHFAHGSGRWAVAQDQTPSGLHKRPGLQGPIDDAFMDSFLIVKPSGKSMTDKVHEWVQAESNHAVVHWRRQFRGEPRVKADFEVTDEDIANYNLVLWGVPSSNRIIARIAEKLPIQWKTGQLAVGSATYSWDHHVPILIYPNPLNPNRYVVLNSGFTFREYDYLNNARQTPKLPDYAVVDIDTPPNSRWPGKIVDAGFFDEQWRLQPDGGRGKARAK